MGREQQAKREEVARGKAAAKAEPVAYVDTELTENVNRLEVEGAEARNVTEAIQVLRVNSDSPSIDKHPEKRMKAAYEEFEKKRLPELKAENNNMRLSQLKQI